MPIYVPDSDKEHQCHLTGKRKSQSTLHHSGAQKRVKSEPESSAKQVDQKSLRDRKENLYPGSQALGSNGTEALNLILNHADRTTDLSDSLKVIKTLEARIRELEAEQLITSCKMDALSKKGKQIGTGEAEAFCHWLDVQEDRIQARESEVQDEGKRVKKQRELIEGWEKRLKMEQEAHEKKVAREHQHFESELNDAKWLQDILSACQSLGHVIQYISVFLRDPEHIVQRGNDLIERRWRNNE
ncbi:hypothetical protein BT96DRAFT_1001345 [Gymnopus androsaceus JB14]|uniref:Uncharacterized protein n=1 Tax=Gymnopus androsaceus JB14 TaxID=1447944 RepID=A0A6A4H224_9AGAR|nr:hypothetical protein BT96DRAFT_1001345 [Gymnopus androsaceus JB14]